MQSEKNNKLSVLTKGYNWKINIKITLETKIEIYFGKNNFIRRDNYFETEEIYAIILQSSEEGSERNG